MALPLLLLLAGGVAAVAIVTATPPRRLKQRPIQRRRSLKALRKAGAVPVIPIPDLAMLVMKASWPTPVSVTKTFRAIAETPKGTIRGKAASEAEIRAWLFDRLWRVVALGIDQDGGWAGFMEGQGPPPDDPFWKGPGRPLTRAEILAVARAWELSSMGPAGADNAYRIKRLMARAAQIIATPKVEHLEKKMFDDTWATMWFVTPFTLAKRQNAGMQALNKLLSKWRKDYGLKKGQQRIPQTAQADLIRRLDLFITAMAMMKNPNYAEGPIPKPRVDWWAVLSTMVNFMVSNMLAVMTYDLEGFYGSYDQFIEDAEAAHASGKKKEKSTK